MNNIYSSSAGGSFPKEGPDLKMIPKNHLRLNRNFISASHNSFTPYQSSCQQRISNNINAFDENKKAHKINSYQGNFFGKYETESDYPLDLTLPKKLPECQHDAIGIINSAVHRASCQKDEHDAREVKHINDIGEEALITNICAMIIRACLPGSSCLWVAAQNNIPHQYFFYWCPQIFGKSIKEMKEHLKLNIAKDKHQASDLSRLAAQVHSERMSSLLKSKRNYSTAFKELVITEACKSNVYVYDTAVKYGVPTSAIYKWCEKIYNVTLSERRQILRAESPEMK